MMNSLTFNEDWKEETILKLIYIGYKKKIHDIIKESTEILNWFCNNYGFSYSISSDKEYKVTTIILIKDNKIVSKYFVTPEDNINLILIQDILKFWKSIDGELFGPRWDIYFTPQEDWT